MTTERKNFRGQFEDEVVLCYFRKHWVKIFPRLATIPLSFFLIFLGYVFMPRLSQSVAWSSTLILAGFLVLLYLVHRQFLMIFRYYLSTVIITNYRVVELDRSVFLHDGKHSIDLSNIQDVRKKQDGILQSFLNYGSLIIVLSGSSETRTLELVPRPEYQFKKINQVKSTYLSAPTQQIASTHFPLEEIPALQRSFERSLSAVE